MMSRVSAIVAIAALGLGACTTAVPETHLHGPKSPAMKDSDMQAAAVINAELTADLVTSGAIG